jgi:hypothetical protein
LTETIDSETIPDVTFDKKLTGITRVLSPSAMHKVTSLATETKAFQLAINGNMLSSKKFAHSYFLATSCNDVDL